MENDPILYATMVSNAVSHRNPLVQVVEEFQRTVQSILHLKQNMQASAAQIELLEARLNSVNGYIQNPTGPRQAGIKLNTLR